MATKTLGTSATSSLTALSFSATDADADVAKIAGGICNDVQANNSFTSFTGTTNSTAAMASISGISGTLTPGMQVAGSGIPFDTQILSVTTNASGVVTGFTMNRAATSGTTTTFYAFVSGPTNVAFSKQGLLYIPNRGVLQVLPGDWVGVDNYGWPILVSSFSIANGPWTHT